MEEGRRVMTSLEMNREDFELIVKNATRRGTSRVRYLIDCMKFFETWETAILKHGPHALDRLLSEE